MEEEAVIELCLSMSRPPNETPVAVGVAIGWH